MTHTHDKHTIDKQLLEQKQQAYMEIQMINQQLKQHAEQLQRVDEKIGEITTLLEALDGIKTTGPMMATIGGGVFLNAELKNAESVYVNVGSNIIVKKKIPEVKTMLLRQNQELEQYKAQLLIQAENMQEQIKNIQEVLQQGPGKQR